VSFSDVFDQYGTFDIEAFSASVTTDMIDRILGKPHITIKDYCALLSDAADGRLEQMAQRAAQTTRNQFGSAIILFTPMYISNFCSNNCPYCSFAHHHDIVRTHLTLGEIEIEARRISETGIRHILVLTGEAPDKAPPDYIEEAVAVLRRYFSSVAIEIYPLSTEGYRRLVEAGADMLTLYQETYHRETYERLHKNGPKADYAFRIDAPERGCRAGMRAVTVGALFGLFDWRSDAFYTALHAEYLQKKYPSIEVGVSFPRLRPQAGSFTSTHFIDDRQFVKMLTALRIFLPSVGITLSTRESRQFRSAVLPLGVTRMSAGVSTSVGGHSGHDSTPQFEIADDRDVAAICTDLLAAGFQPVMHDWNFALTENRP
jgi:2-iminoacetate synthase